MAGYNADRNYAQEILDLISRGGDAAMVQQLANERIRKQQGMDTGHSVFDDTYRAAQDYIRNAGLSPAMDEGVNYAGIANDILASGQSEDVIKQYLLDALAGRQAKLDTGRYDEWANSGEPAFGIPYNGTGSIYEALTTPEQPKRNTGHLTDHSTQSPTGVIAPASYRMSAAEKKEAEDRSRAWNNGVRGYVNGRDYQTEVVEPGATVESPYAGITAGTVPTKTFVQSDAARDALLAMIGWSNQPAIMQGGSSSGGGSGGSMKYTGGYSGAKSGGISAGRSTKNTPNTWEISQYPDGIKPKTKGGKK